MKTILFTCVILATTARAAAQVPEWQWARSGSNAGNSAGRKIITDHNGNVYVTGSFANTLSLGSASLTSAGNTDIFLVKYDNNGSLIWAKRAGGSGADEGMSIAADTAGDVYITGSFSGSADFGSITLTGSGFTDIFLAKYSSAGDLIWVKQAGGQAPDIAACVHAAGNNVYITGYFANSGGSPPTYGTANFGSTVLTSHGSGDIFLAKYYNNGDLVWVKNAGGVFTDMGLGIGTDSLKNIYISGSFSEPWSYFDTIKLYGVNQGFMSGSAYVARYDSSGNVVWATAIGGNAGIAGGGSILPEYSITDKYGNTYFIGSYSNCTMNFGNSVYLSCLGNFDIFLAKYNADGNVVWARRAGGQSFNFLFAVTLDKNNDVCLAGSLNEYIVFGGIDTLFGQNDPDAFVVKYNKNGTAEWAIGAGGNGTDESYGVACDDIGNVYTTGYFTSGTASFGNHSVTNTGGGQEFFIAKMRMVPVGVEEAKGIRDNVLVYPNPAGEELNIVLPAVSSGSFISITDITGRMVHRQKLTEEKTTIDLKHFPPAIYLYRVTSEDIIQAQGKLVKQ